MVIENVMKKTLRSFNVSISECGAEHDSVLAGKLLDGERDTFNVTCSGYLVEGDPFQGEINITYILGAGSTSLQHNIRGLLSGQTEK